MPVGRVRVACSAAKSRGTKQHPGSGKFKFRKLGRGNIFLAQPLPDTHWDIPGMDPLHLEGLALYIRDMIWSAKLKGSYMQRKKTWPTTLTTTSAQELISRRAAIVPASAPHVRLSRGRLVVRFSCLQDVTTFFEVEPFFFSRYS